MQTYQELSLATIDPCPDNPRKRFKGKDFDDLVTSIRAKGVLQPITVRPIGDRFQIVFGERRFRALVEIAKKNGGIDAGTIPALIKELSEADAFDEMTIENLHRSDLTPFEEADNFKRYVDKNGPESIKALAERTGIKEDYIHRRLAIMTLPKKIIKLWEKDMILIGHLEQFMRIAGDKNFIKATLEWFEDREGHETPYGITEYPTIKELKAAIDDHSPKISDARFKTDGCLMCAHNSELQSKLWATEMTNPLCRKPTCFKQKQNNHLMKNWSKSAAAKKHKTTGFRFASDFQYWRGRGTHYHEFFSYYKTSPECKACEHHVSLVDLSGKVVTNRVCVSKNHECFHKNKEWQPPKKGEKRKPEKKEFDPSKPRVEWHGTHFRNKFYNEQIPLRLAEIDPADLRVKQVALFKMVENSPVNGLKNWFNDRHHIVKVDKKEDREDYYGYPYLSLGGPMLFTAILKLTLTEVETDIRDLCALEVVDNVTSESRHLIGLHVGIDLASEWSMDEEYLSKKTKAELLHFGDTSGIFSDEKVETFLFEKLLKKRGKFTACKKGELVRLFLESGVELKGKVPAEILKVEKEVDDDEKF